MLNIPNRDAEHPARPLAAVPVDDTHPYMKRYEDGELGFDHEKIREAIALGFTVDELFFGRDLDESR